MYNSLQLRELFHLEFLRWFGRKVKSESYALKGGANLRFFFNSIRYSEDMDLDIKGVQVHVLKDIAIKILQNLSFRDSLRTFGVERIVPPDISAAKQTETTQRFKAHLITLAGEDLFTKIEFSRRGFKGKVVIQPVSTSISRPYMLPPLLVPHYDAEATILHKIGALADRPEIQARDIFDLYILSSQSGPFKIKENVLSPEKMIKAYNNVFEISFERFHDTVISYLSSEDQRAYDLSSIWDEIKIKTANFIDEIRRRNG